MNLLLREISLALSLIDRTLPHPDCIRSIVLVKGLVRSGLKVIRRNERARPLVFLTDYCGVLLEGVYAGELDDTSNFFVIVGHNIYYLFIA